MFPKGALPMTRLLCLLSNLILFTSTLLTLVVDVVRFLRLCLRSPTTLAAENLFLRKQLALYQERHITPRRATNATRLTLVWLGRWFDWRQALAIVQPQTFIRWHRQRFRLFWRWKSRPGRPPIPAGLQALTSQRALRAVAGHTAAGMLGLPASPVCKPLAVRPHAVGTTLPWRAPPHGLGTWHSTAASGAPAGHDAADSWRLAS